MAPEGIVSVRDGKTLKRHLTGHGLDPQSYRHRYGLPAGSSMVALSCATMRSELSKSNGLARIADRDEGGQSAARSCRKAA